MTAIQIKALHKTYGDVTAIDDLSLTVDDGEVFGLLGPNGAGKTTTMEILTGQLTPESGQVTVLGIEPVAQRDLTHLGRPKSLLSKIKQTKRRRE